MPDDVEAELVAEQQRTLDFSLAASHIVLNLVGEISKKLITPLADIDVAELTPDEQELFLEEAHKCALRLRETIRFALTVHADIEQAMNADEAAS